MRWDNLFDDLESQLEQELGAEEGDLLAEEERLRLGRLTLRDRVVAMTPPGDGAAQQLKLAMRDGTLLTAPQGTIDRVGRDRLDLAEHEAGVPRRAAAVGRIRIVPFTELLLVRF